MKKLKEFIKPNLPKIVITLILIIIYSVSFFYLLSMALCGDDGPQSQQCPSPNALLMIPASSITTPTFIIYEAFDAVGYHLFYNKIYWTEENKRIYLPKDKRDDSTLTPDGYSLLPRLPGFISSAGVLLFDILAVIINLIYGYFLACLIYLAYRPIKQKFHL